MASLTPARNSSTRSGWHATPRSPLAQSPAGKLNSTWVRPLASRCALISAELNSYGNRYSTPWKPASAAALKRARKSCSVNSMDRLAAKRGIGFSLIEQGNGSRCIVADQGQIFEFVDGVDRKSVV